MAGGAAPQPAYNQPRAFESVPEMEPVRARQAAAGMQGAPVQPMSRSGDRVAARLSVTASRLVRKNGGLLVGFGVGAVLMLLGWFAMNG